VYSAERLAGSPGWVVVWSPGERVVGGPVEEW
jgi:hypothetical protein